MEDKNEKKYVPGDGIRSLKSSPLFRAVNYELYVKPNSIVMAIGAIAMTGCAAYIYYMRQKYKAMGYYAAVAEDGTETFKKKVSKWDI